MSPRRAETSLRRAAAVAATVALPFALGACQDGDPEKCATAKANVDRMVEAQNWDAATEQRNYAFKVCGDEKTAVVTALDKKINDAKKSIAEQKLAEEAKAQRQKQVLQLFLDFVGKHKDAPEKVPATESCVGKEVTKERWCSKSVKTTDGSVTFDVRYWEKEPEAFRFMVVPPEPTTCADLGGTSKRTWTVQGNVPRHHCTLTSGAAAGLEAMVSEAKSAPVYVFSAKYPELDSGMKNRLEGK